MKPGENQHLRIVLISFSYWPPDFGGEILHCIERLQALAERGHSVVVLARRPRGFARAERRGAISVRRCPIPGGGLAAQISFVLWAAITLLRVRFDALHLLTVPGLRAPTRALAAWLLSGIAKLRAARTVSVIACADSEDEPWQVKGRTGLFKRVYFHQVDCLVAVSPVLFQSLDRWWPGKAVLLTYAVRDDLFTPLSNEERRAARQELGIPEDGVVFITIGSAGRRKGYDLLAQAFAAAASRHRNWYLWLVGPMSHAEGCGTEERELTEMMAPLRQVEPRVRRFGRINDRAQLRRLLGASDVFVFPTRREGMPISPMEAMAMARPVIVSRIPGVTDVACVDQETGLFVPVEDVKALERAMDQLGCDLKLRASLGRRARQRIDQAFSWGAHIARWEELYSRGVRGLTF